MHSLICPFRSCLSLSSLFLSKDSLESIILLASLPACTHTHTHRHIGATKILECMSITRRQTAMATASAWILVQALPFMANVCLSVCVRTFACVSLSSLLSLSASDRLLSSPLASPFSCPHSMCASSLLALSLLLLLLLLLNHLAHNWLFTLMT